MNDVVKGLQEVLADSAVLYVKTQNYHWNVEGASFYSLHAFFEDMYRDLFKAIDEIAERIRALGGNAPGSMASFLKHTCLLESEGGETAEKMISALLHDQKEVTERLKNLQRVASEKGDEATADLAIRRIAQHEKNHWMLKSHLAK